MANIIEAFFGNGNRWGVNINYSLEKKPLSTMGPLTLIDDLPEDFLVMNGDILTDISYEELFQFHIDNKNLITVGGYERSDKQEYGILEINDEKDLIGFKEKPILNNLVSMGVYIMNKRILEYIPKNTFFGFDHLMLKLISNNELPKVYPYKGLWLDIGRPDDYEKASEIYTKFFS